MDCQRRDECFLRNSITRVPLWRGHFLQGIRGKEHRSPDLKEKETERGVAAKSVKNSYDGNIASLERLRRVELPSEMHHDIHNDLPFRLSQSVFLHLRSSGLTKGNLKRI